MTLTTNNNGKGCLTIILDFLGINIQKKTAPKKLPYRVRDDFLTPAELSFYKVLRIVVGEKFTVCTKVGLADIFFVARPNENMAYRNRISQRHVDFLLCRPENMKPVLGIELDDSSHNNSRNQERDRFKNEVFQAAELPLTRIPVQRTYNPRQLAEKLVGILRTRPNKPVATKEKNEVAPKQNQKGNETVSEKPTCPKCGAAMVLRTAKKRKHKGKKFYGCTNYPQCHGILPIEKKNVA